MDVSAAEILSLLITDCIDQSVFLNHLRSIVDKILGFLENGLATLELIMLIFALYWLVHLELMLNILCR